MIETVKLAGENTYVINDTVKLYNITLEEEDIFYDVDFDEKTLDEKPLWRCARSSCKKP